MSNRMLGSGGWTGPRSKAGNGKCACSVLKRLAVICVLGSGLPLPFPVVAQLPADLLDSVPRMRSARPRSEYESTRLRATALLLQGRIEEQRGERESSLRSFQRAFRLDEDAQVALPQIIRIAMVLGRTGEAARYAAYYSRLVDSPGELDDPILAERIAMLLADQAEYVESLRMYERLLQRIDRRGSSADPSGLTATKFEMGRLYFLTDNFVKAAESFRGVLAALAAPQEFGLDEPTRKSLLARPEITYTLIGEALLEAGDTEMARAVFVTAAEYQHEKERDRWLELQHARCDAKSGHNVQARQRLEAYLEQRSEFGGREPYRLLQKLLEGENAPEKFREWQQRDLDNFPLTMFVAEQLREHKDLPQAIQLYEQGAKQQPTLEAYRALAELYLATDQPKRFLQVLGKVVNELNEIDPLAEVLATLLADQKRLEEIWNLGKTLVNEERAEGGVGVAAACGLMAVEANHFEVSDEFMSLLSSSGSADLLVPWGMKLLEKEEVARAVDTFRQALQAPHPPDEEPAIRHYLAGALELDHKTDEALKEAQRAVALRPDLAVFQLRPCWILYHAERWHEAVSAYEQWLAKYEQDYSDPGLRELVRDARFVMSSLCQQLGKRQDALEWLERVLDEFPDDIGAMNDLGYLMVEQANDLERATRMIRRAVASDPDNEAYRDSLGWALFRQGNWDEAVQELTQAASRNDPDPIILDHLADALWASGKGDQARDVWNSALKRLESENDGSATTPPSATKLRSSIEQKLKRALESQ